MMEEKKAEKELTVRGVVIPSAWDEDFNVVAVKISALDEKEYLVEGNGTQDELIKHLRKSLRVTGRVRVEKDGTEMIKVSNFEVGQRAASGRNARTAMEGHKK